MILFFDTETTGVPKNYKAPINDLNNWPRVIQLAWALYDESGNLQAKKCDLIKPEGWEIPKDPFWIEHGYSTEVSMEHGKPILMALMSFVNALEKSKLIIAHNLSFDYPILGAEMLRAKISSINKPKKFCTMASTTDLLQLPGPYGFKWPKLEELHRYLFQCEFEGAHDALNDVMATAKCYFELRNRNLIQI